MFDLGWPELLVIAIVLIVVVGPKDLPKVLRGFGRTTAKMRAMAGDFRKQFDEALREAELDDVKGMVDEVKRLDPRSEIKKHLSPLEQAGRDIRSGLDQAMKPKPTAPPTPTDGATAVEAKSAAPAKPGATKLPLEEPSSKAGKPKATSKPAAAKPAAARKIQPKKPAAEKAVAKSAPRAKKTTGTAS